MKGACNMSYQSKKDWWLGALMLGATGMTTAAMLVQEGIGFQSSLVLLITIFVYWIWFATYYTVENGTLITHSGPIKRKYEISKFETIRSTRNPLSAPALSLDRIEIRGPGIFILVSPEDKEDFIDHLIEINGHIQYME